MTLRRELWTCGILKIRIKELYFSRLNVPFENSLVPIQSDTEVRELIKLCLECDFVCIYVEHNDDNTAKGKNVLSNEGGDQNTDSGVGEEAYFPNADEVMIMMMSGSILMMMTLN